MWVEPQFRFTQPIKTQRAAHSVELYGSRSFAARKSRGNGTESRSLRSQWQ